MFKVHNQLLSPAFDPYFNSVRTIHRYNTILSRKMNFQEKNYGIFNIKFQGAEVWNDVSDDIELLPL